MEKQKKFLIIVFSIIFCIGIKVMPAYASTSSQDEIIVEDSYSEGEITTEEEITEENTEEVVANSVANSIAEEEREIVLILDCSGSMEGTPIDVLKEAAKSFCSTILYESNDTKIGIVAVTSYSEKIQDLTSDAMVLADKISGINAGGGTNLYSAISISDEILSESQAKEKDIVIMTDGLPESGEFLDAGKYTVADSPDNYGYANACNTLVESLANKYKFYTLGFFQVLSGQELDFGNKFLKDIGIEGYYEAKKIDELISIFEKIADTILEPVSIDLSEFTLVEIDNNRVVYKIHAYVKNNNANTSITNVFATISPGNGASVIEGEVTQNCDGIEGGKSIVFNWLVNIDRTLYPDGGNHVFSVSAGADRTVTLEQRGSIPVEAINTQSNELNFSTDVWNFKNFTQKPCELKSYHKNALLHGLSATEQMAIKDALQNIGGKGHCYGMSALIILDKMNVEDVSAIAKVDNIRKAKNKDDVKSLICYYHVSQMLPIPRSVIQRYMSLSVKEQITLLEKKANEVKSGGCPVLVCFGAKGWGAHAVVAYAVEPGKFISSKTKKSYNRRVLLYDCNVRDWSLDNCLLYNEGTDQWEIPYYVSNGVVSTNEKAYLMSCASEIGDIDVKNRETGFFNYIAELGCKNWTKILMKKQGSDQRWEIDGKSGSVTGSSDLIAYNDAAVNGEDNPGLHVVLPDETSTYEFSTASGSEEELDLNILYNDLYLAVNSTSATDAIMNPNGSVTIKGNNGDFHITIADDTADPEEFNTYIVDGSNTGDTTVFLTDEGLKIEGDNIKGLKIEATDNEVSDSVTIEETSSVEYVRDKDSLSLVAGDYNINKAEISLSSDKFVYNGKSQIPEISLLFDGNKLTEGTDYEVILPEDVINVGEKHITINGINTYNGSVHVTYEIITDEKSGGYKKQTKSLIPENKNSIKKNDGSEVSIKNKKTNAPSTGDSSSMLLYVFLLIVSLSSVGLLLKRKRTTE